MRSVLRNYGLPHTLGTFDFGSVPPGAAGAYVAQTDQFLMRVGARDQTIIHEGAHAEHYAAADIVGAKFPADDKHAAIGALVLSEAFVGHRLAGANGFMAFEYDRLAKYAKPLIAMITDFLPPSTHRVRRIMETATGTSRAMS